VRLLGPDAAQPHAAVSITDAAAVERAVSARGPDVVFNCAAYNAVDRAESEATLAYAVNSQGAYNVAAACARHGARMVHFSTNFVFDGSLNRPYVESDEPAPLGVYASSKLEGEVRAQEALPDLLIIRSAGIFGGARGFPARILAQAAAGRQLRVVSDQRVNPTYAGDLAAAALELTGQSSSGIVHAAAAGCCAWDEFARAVLVEHGIEARVDSITTAAYPSPARRPHNGCLATNRFRPLRPWQEALHESVLVQPPDALPR
jgi:dTDP-4-dehydrorhamnose reductase